MSQDHPLRRIGALTDYHSKTLLLAFSAYTATVTAVLWALPGLPAVLRVPIALPILVFIPGYALVKAVFPHARWAGTDQSAEPLSQDDQSEVRLSPLERGFLSVFASIVIVSVVALAGSVTVGIGSAVIFAGVSLVTIVASLVGVSRTPEPQPGRHRPNVSMWDASTGWLQGMTRGLTPVAIGLVVVLLAMSGVLGLAGGDSSPTTEFYVADENATESMDAAEGELTYHLRIAQHSDEQQEYTVVVTAPGEGDAAQSSGDREQFSLVVPADSTVERPYRFDASAIAGDSPRQFLLYQGEAPESPTPDNAHRVLRVLPQADGG